MLRLRALSVVSRQAPWAGCWMARQSTGCFELQRQRVRCRVMVGPLLARTDRRSFSIFGSRTEEEQREREKALNMPVEERKAAIGALDEEIKVLTRRRAVLSGELYTLRGRFKAMGRDYGLPFMVWWTAVWLATGVGIYSAISYGEVDVVQVIGQLDLMLGTQLASRLPDIDPTVGTVAMTIACNEMLEPVRLPIVVVSTPTVVRMLGYK